MTTTEYICMRLSYDDDLYNQTVRYVQNVFVNECFFFLLLCYQLYLYMIFVFDLLATKVVYVDVRCPKVVTDIVAEAVKMLSWSRVNLKNKHVSWRKDKEK